MRHKRLLVLTAAVAMGAVGIQTIGAMANLGYFEYEAMESCGTPSIVH
ncbi:MAG: hypothetical protein ACRYF2_12955 [Janthinobacterium lividum]